MKRYDVLIFLINKYQLRSYLEIGVRESTTFSRINLEDKIGINPGGSTLSKVLSITSDQFFLQNDRKFDLIFVDGDHRSAQALRDLKNSLISINDNGFVVVHDTMPHNLEYTQPNWCGTVFRAVQEINQDPSISLHTVNTDHGVSILSLEPSPPGPLYKDFFDFMDNLSLCLNIVTPENLAHIKFYGK
ncbi:class I SAM-dependent methyltransferase [Flavilitoribacter nigricans]|uniref:Class I SAM-dependent methyltransferase n=1 Tax=Flavilitoribacter nigricans (strain ATCC 23147 / DSM 23189 / NBRC 102662 / NCIMB 1420 / SS-2) TaxID=1122177 RepID=A0A2D0N106_FLAN2|nr:class I SAM-dependent methyltransferase [Flavilitoribacter nigricans]PHN02211.1 hypothetical protein CRP01_33290 [Flavilitoribacter nigricans DSM 23189 = NBRC 102662]